MERIAVFDFDGTITKKDSFIELIKYVHGRRALVIGLLLNSYWLILMNLNLFPNWKAKQKLFTYFFKNIKLTEFNIMCKSFFETNKQLIYEEAKACIEAHKSNGDHIVIISASLINWVQYFANWLGADNVICTEPEIKDGLLTGHFQTNNCYGKEKLNRFLEKYHYRNHYYLVVYGDSRGDRDMLNYADKSYYKKFKH